MTNLQAECAAEDERMQKAQKKQYKYKDLFGQIYFTEIPARANASLKGQALTLEALDKSSIL